MRRPLLYTFVSAGAIALFTACAGEQPSAPSTAPGLAAAGEPTGSFIVLAQSETSLPGGFAAQIAQAGGSVDQAYPAIGVAVVHSAAADFRSRAAAIAGVRSVTPDVVRQWVPPQKVVAWEGAAPQGVEGAVASIGDGEPFFFLQWAPGAIHAPEAWNAGARGTGVRVAILDGGIQSTHPDLAANLDVAHSRSFVLGVPQFDTDVGTFWHGTHVAGIVAARANHFGTIGIAPNATLIGVKVLHNGSGSFSAVMNGIVYAATPIDEGGAGANVINMSLGATFAPSSVDDAELIAALSRVTNYAWQRGTTVIASAGNDGLDLDANPGVVTIPAMSSRVIAISATGPVGFALGATNFDRPASYTNTGLRVVDFAGPGGDFVLPGDDSCTLGTITRPCWVFDLVFSTNVNGWAWAAGTSMASPAAAGVAALIIEHNGGVLAPQAVHNLMRKSADDLGAPGEDPVYGAGRVNAERAVMVP